MSDYKRFHKQHSNWPPMIGDLVGRRVRLKYELETRGGDVFEEGEILIVAGTWRGKMRLSNGKKYPNHKTIAWIHPNEVELIRPDSIIWRSKEAFLLFCISVAGKKSRPTQRRVEAFLESCVRDGEDFSPFTHIKCLINSGSLRRELKRHGFGQYTKLVKAFTEVARADLDLDRCKTRDLERIHGIGPKTSRYFIARTRPKARVAVLDRHILRWLREECHYPNIPKSTPQSSMRYYEVESLFLAEAKKRRVRPSRLDAQIWDRYSGYSMSLAEKNQVDEVAAFE